MADETPDPEPFDLTTSPGHLLHRAQQFAADRFGEAVATSGLTQRQFAVLSATHAEEGLTQTQLVKATGIDRSTLAELVARMVRNGLLVREKLADDARANAVHLSEDGRRLVDVATVGAMEADAAILDALPSSKRKGFLKMLKRIACTLESSEAAEKKARDTAKAKEKAEKKKARKKAKAEALSDSSD
jgi:DNA-binding MarR family transcriptional regulator